jgi:ABC-type polar amino acid transport system ATPase subunit
MEPPAPIVSLQSATKQFPARGKVVHKGLDDVSLDVRQGEVVVLLGPSGSGKSTLLRCVNLLCVPDRGRLQVGDVSWTADPALKQRTPDGRTLLSLRRKVGMVFQHFNLFPHMTAAENVMAGLVHTMGMKKAEARPIAEAELERVGLADRVNNYPSQLSGGQKQRVAIARAIATKPIAMLFDEPTSALDPELRGSVLAVMQDLAAQGMTMIVVTHELGFARSVGNRILFMDKGRAIEQGDARAFLDDPQTERARQFLAEIN